MFVSSTNITTESYEVSFIQTLEVNCCDLILEWLANSSDCQQVLIVTDSHVAAVQKRVLDEMKLKFESQKQISVTQYIVPEGEVSKSLDEAERLWNYLAEICFTRGDLLIAFGGGMIGDLVGFCASTFLRGVPFIQVPTTLLSQIDSSIGGKVAVNLPSGKNLVGQFKNPERVIIDVSILRTLNEHVLQDGLGELIKYAMMGDRMLLDWLLRQGNLEAVRSNIHNKPLEFEHIVRRCLEIKQAVVEKDFREARERKYLNLGHTLGHAIEQAEGYKLGHGYCVMLGLYWAGEIGWKVYCEKSQLNQSGIVIEQYRRGYAYFKTLMQDLMRRYGFKWNLSVKADALLPYLVQDKKRVKSEIQMILPCFDQWIRGHEASSQNVDPMYLGKAYENQDDILEQLELYLEIVQVPIVCLERWIIDLEIHE